MNSNLKLISPSDDTQNFDAPDLVGIFRRLASRQDDLLQGLPFTGSDVTAGAENELQTVVSGQREDVDLPASILQSNYFANILRRARSGDTSSRVADRLEEFLLENRENIWENSWVRFPRRALCTSPMPCSGTIFWPTRATPERDFAGMPRGSRSSPAAKRSCGSRSAIC